MRTVDEIDPKKIMIADVPKNAFDQLNEKSRLNAFRVGGGVLTSTNRTNYAHFFNYREGDVIMTMKHYIILYEKFLVFFAFY